MCRPPTARCRPSPIASAKAGSDNELRTPLRIPLSRHRPGGPAAGLGGDRPPRARPDGLAATRSSTRRPAVASSSARCPATERWAVDEVAYPEAERTAGVKVVTSTIMDAELPSEHFDGVFVSNFLEHLYDQEAIAAFLERMHGAMEPGGRIAIMGPNYRYCAERVLGLRRPLRRAHPRGDRRAPLRGRLRARADHPPLPALLLPRHPAALAAADPASTCGRRSPGSCSASSSW